MMLAQVLAVGIAGLSSGRPDVVLSFGGPPLVGPVLSGLIAKMWGCRLVTLIHDVYPDVAIESGSISNAGVIQMSRGLERLQYRLSTRIVVLGDSWRTALIKEKGIPAHSVDVVPVWLDPDEIRPMSRDNPWRREQGLTPDQFVVLYAGTVGIISGAEMLGDVARNLPPDVVVLVVGGGVAWRALDDAIRSGAAPSNLRVLPYQPRSRIREVQASADLSIITLAPRLARTSVPSKVQAYMAAGRPVLASADSESETASLIRRGGFGRVVAPGDAPALAQAILDARADAPLRRQWGEAARSLFEREYSKERRISDFNGVLLSALSANAGAVVVYEKAT
jgi:colanic acid biosynthesis glycosyl transferase WcaI